MVNNFFVDHTLVQIHKSVLAAITGTGIDSIIIVICRQHIQMVNHIQCDISQLGLRKGGGTCGICVITIIHRSSYGAGNGGIISAEIHPIVTGFLSCAAAGNILIIVFGIEHSPVIGDQRCQIRRSGTHQYLKGGRTGVAYDLLAGFGSIFI